MSAEQRAVESETESSGTRHRPWWLWAPVALSLVSLVLITFRRAWWFDEAVSVKMSRLPGAELWELVGEVDAVHGLYYLLLGSWADVVGHELWQYRLLSALAMAGTVALTVEIVWRVGSPRAALFAGLVLAFLPSTLQLGTETRSYAIAAAIATLSSLLLLLALRGRPRPWLWVAYGVSMALLGYVFLYAMLLLPAHALTLLLARPARSIWRGFLFAALGAVLAVIPLLLMASQQRSQIDWIPPLRFGAVLKAWSDLPSRPLALILTAILGALAVLAVVRLRNQLLVALALPWLTLPVTVLAAVSVVYPTFYPRYVFFSAPALAILVGLGLASIRSRWLLAGLGATLVLLSATGASEVWGRSGVDGWGDKGEFLQSTAEPGDGVLFAPHVYGLNLDEETASVVSPLLVDAEIFPEGEQSAADALAGSRMGEYDRVWLVPRHELSPADEARYEAIFDEAGLELASSQMVGGIRLDLYIRPVWVAADR